MLYNIFMFKKIYSNREIKQGEKKQGMSANATKIRLPIVNCTAV